MKVAFLHDVEMDYIGGAELSNKKIIDAAKHLGFDVFYDNLKDFDKTKRLVQSATITIVNNIVDCEYELELIDFLLKSNLPYVKWEHDYGLCAKRTIYCYIDSQIKNCCDNNKFHSYRNLFANSKLNVFQSPLHFKYYKRLYGKAVSNKIILPPPINVEKLKSSKNKNKDEVVFLGDLKFIKGANALLDYAEENPNKSIVVYGENKLRRPIPKNVELKSQVSNEKVLEALGKAEYFFFKPKWFEPSGRVAAEAFLSGAKIISNEKVGTFSYDFYPDNIEEARKQMSHSPNYFWTEVQRAIENTVRVSKFKSILVFKNYGGLGDRFIALPAINKLKEVSEKVTLGAPKNLINVLKRNTVGLDIIPIDDYDTIDFSGYDKVLNLGNYPKSRRFNNKGVIDYETHYKLKQHALKHYIDAIATLHPKIDNSYNGYPYFRYNTDLENPYFIIHPGAGFSPKWWATDRYVNLIKTLLIKLPNYSCKVILGPDDPSPDFFNNIERVTLETGNLDAVEMCISGASFHIGNDSGITHFAGVFNIPSVSFHGLTGPGAWATLAENTEVIWGKPGHCNIQCKYDTAISCEHRNCLNSITVNKALRAVYKLLQKSLNMNNKRIKYVFNPEVKFTKLKQGFILNANNKELLLEFEKMEEFDEFSSLIQNDLFEDEIKQEALKSLIEALLKEELTFAIPI